MRIRTIYPMLLVVLCLLVASCGDDDDSGDSGSSAGNSGSSGDNSGGASGAKGTKLKLEADPGGALKFDKTSLTAKAGKVTVVLSNPSSVPHAIEVEGNGVEAEGETVTDGGTSTASADLKPGEYEFYCPVDDHKEAGMEGTLTVN
ncbi:MAG: cupredoxin domain-containing protein [Thermoleophilaceae bacterium]